MCRSGAWPEKEADRAFPQFVRREIVSLVHIDRVDRVSRHERHDIDCVTGARFERFKFRWLEDHILVLLELVAFHHIAALDHLAISRRIEENEFAHVVTSALAGLFPASPPSFLARTPHGYYEQHVMERDLRFAGFHAEPAFQTVASHSRAASARIPAVAYCQGTPLRNEIETRGRNELSRATDVCAAAMAEKFGPGPVDGKIQAHIVMTDA